MSEPLDPRIDSERREGLTGTAPQSVYDPLPQAEQITVAPDGRPAAEQPAWRRDFPIDWPEDLYVARRDLTKFMVLTSCAFACGQYWIAARSLGRGQEAPLPRRIAALSEVAVGSTVTFDYPTAHDPCVLIRPAPDRLLAYSQACTHLACPVVPRPAEGVIHCPCHEGWFDLETGRPIAGPPRRPLPRINVEVRGDEVWATGVELRAV